MIAICYVPVGITLPLHDGGYAMKRSIRQIPREIRDEWKQTLLHAWDRTGRPVLREWPSQTAVKAVVEDAARHECGCAVPTGA